MGNRALRSKELCSSKEQRSHRQISVELDQRGRRKQGIECHDAKRPAERHTNSRRDVTAPSINIEIPQTPISAKY